VGESIARFLQHFGEVMGNVILALLYFSWWGRWRSCTPGERPAPDTTAERIGVPPWRKENETIAEAHRQG
jgi:hypothetical protein